jgi:hypothetical protein
MLTFNLKKEWFNKIKNGEKTHEYRERKPYWVNRISKEIARNGRDFDIEFVLGYAKASDKNKRLLAICTGISTKNGLESDLKVDRDVYDIEFELIKE